jgi:4-diphosphocytidyl-2-C-methyl-D-erythritol kinase
MATETEFAPAKVNLSLHVTGRRADGYHLLDSLVVFVGVGDRVTISPGEGLQIMGPQAGALQPDEDNLCLQAARAMGGGVAVTLEKVLPVSSGIGGGSADAAAVLRAMARMGRALPTPDAVLALGADVPVCLAGQSLRMQGVGERLTPVTLPLAWLVLANPGVAVSTPSVFRALTRRENAAMPDIPAFADAVALAAFLKAQRNDLEAPAISLAPDIADVVAALSGLPGCLLARMSGSGATCFGLFKDEASARVAERKLRDQRADWWIAAGAVL